MIVIICVFSSRLNNFKFSCIIIDEVRFMYIHIIIILKNEIIIIEIVIIL